MAAQENGLVASLDSGTTWARVLIDSSDPGGLPNNVNSIYSVDQIDGLLLAGTDTGLALLYLDQSGVIDSQEFHAFPEYDSTSQGDASSARIVRAKAQPFYDSTGVGLDSLAIWTIHRPLSLEGRPIVGRHNIDSTRWLRLQVDVVTHDVNFLEDTAYVVGEAGIRFTTLGFNPGLFDGEIVEVQQKINGTVTDALTDDLITVIEVKGDTLLFGTDNGFAISHGSDDLAERAYRIVRVNNDSLAADAVVTHSPSSTGGGLVGSFIPALGVQYVDGEKARVWVSNRHRELGDTVAISVGRVVPVDTNGVELPPDQADQAVGFQRKWAALYRDDFAWNFAFHPAGPVFAATSGGLVFNIDETSTAWDTVALVDDDGFPLLGYEASVYGVEVSPPYLWAGTDDRTVRFDLFGFANGQSFAVVDSASAPDEVYAFPVPFSHVRDPIIDFHFVVDSPTEVTLEIYDFAMNLVARVIDNESYPSGIYPGPSGRRATWDGYNGRGEQVAVGVYYFKVLFGGGDQRWGKLAVIP
jgi:hypothetical protein